ncbi:MAG: hypothetical protein IKO44_04400, partial [Ruminococcus sp.]|nr:hypothetical protein [Ruminococcus sp.]
HNPRLTPLHVICLPFFRHISQILLERRQPSCVEFRQSDKKMDVASDEQGLCGVALEMYIKALLTVRRGNSHRTNRNLAFDIKKIFVILSEKNAPGRLFFLWMHGRKPDLTRFSALKNFFEKIFGSVILL